MKKPITIEPARYGMTGPGIMGGKLRTDDLDFFTEANTYCIDAPRYIPCGSISTSELPGGKIYAASTISRE